MSFGETVPSMEVHACDWFGQFSALHLPLECVDGAVGGTVDGSMSGSKGVVVAESGREVRLGCR